MRAIEIYIELCVKRMKEFGYNEEDARELCRADLSNLKVE